MRRHDKDITRTGLGIGALSERTGVHIETIRYYERIGIMPAPPRSAGGQRVYDASHLKRLAFVRRSRELGFSLDEFRELLRQLADVGAVKRRIGAEGSLDLPPPIARHVCDDSCAQLMEYRRSNTVSKDLSWHSVVFFVAQFLAVLAELL